MKYSFSPHQYLLSMLQVVLTRTVLGSVSTGRYGGNSNNGSPQNPDSPPGQPMSDDHLDHLDDHDHEGFTAYKDLNKKLSRSDQISVPGIYVWISTQSENRNLKTAAKWRNPEHKSKKSRPQNKVVNSFEIFRKPALPNVISYNSIQWLKLWSLHQSQAICINVFMPVISPSKIIIGRLRTAKIFAFVGENQNPHHQFERNNGCRVHHNHVSGKWGILFENAYQYFLLQSCFSSKCWYYPFTTE